MVEDLEASNAVQEEEKKPASDSNDDANPRMNIAVSGFGGKMDDPVKVQLYELELSS